MGKRRTARILALSILYQSELRPDEDIEDLIHYTLLLEDYEVSVVRFAQRLISGVLKHFDEIDALINVNTDNWSISRMANIDKNIMRISIFEMAFTDDIPKNVSINEAVEIAKNYSTEKSGEFVNGVLDKIGNQIKNQKKEDDRRGKS